MVAKVRIVYKYGGALCAYCWTVARLLRSPLWALLTDIHRRFLAKASRLPHLYCSLLLDNYLLFTGGVGDGVGTTADGVATMVDGMGSR